jgi:hypothetical protein
VILLHIVVNILPAIYTEEEWTIEIGTTLTVEVVPEVYRVAVGREYQLTLA